MQPSVNSDIVTDKPSNSNSKPDPADDMERMRGGLWNTKPKAKPEIEKSKRQENPHPTELDLSRDAWLKPSAKQI